MTIEVIQTRAKAEPLHDAAVEIRELLDDAAKAITLPDDRDVREEILELVMED